MILAFMAEGFEEVELLGVVDVLRRAKAEVYTVSVTGERDVTSSHGVTIRADMRIEDAPLSGAELLFLPGGMPGTLNLEKNLLLRQALLDQNDAGRRIAAICAAPSVLGHLGILMNKRATCFPGFEGALLGADYTSKGVVTDRNVTTARGMGFAVDLGIELVKLLFGKDKAEEVKIKLQHPDYQ